MGEPVRVLELLVSTDLGGGPAHVRDLVAALAGPEFRFTVAGPAGGALVGAFTAAGAAFAPLAADRLSLGALRETVRLARPGSPGPPRSTPSTASTTRATRACTSCSSARSHGEATG